VILSKFWSRYALQNFRKRKFLGDDQGELSKGTVLDRILNLEYRYSCVYTLLTRHLKFRAYYMGTRDTVSLLINDGSFSKASAPPFPFLEDENIFPKSARVVLILLQFHGVPRTTRADF
jgi:hypothetical protein